MPKSFPSYSSLLLKCDHRSFPICVLYLWHESQHPEKVHWRTKRPLYTCFKRKEKKKKLKPDSGSAMLYDKDLHLRGEMWKLIKGNITKLESGAQKGELSQTYHSHTYRFQQKETYLIPLVGSDTIIASRRKKNFPLAWQQLSQWETVTAQPIQKISQYKKSLYFELPVSSNWHFVYHRPSQLFLLLYKRVSSPLLYWTGM